MATVNVTQEQAVSGGEVLARQTMTKAKELGGVALAKGRASFAEAHEAGMFKGESIASFNKDLINIVSTVKEDVNKVKANETTAQAAIMAALSFKPSDPEKGFIFMNSLAMWMEVFAGFFSWLLSASTAKLVSMLICSYLIAYVLYFCVVLSNRTNLMGLAIVGYGIYALLNALNTMGSLILIVPPVFYGIKTLACGYCAFYAYQLRDKINGAEQIP